MTEADAPRTRKRAGEENQPIVSKTLIRTWEVRWVLLTDGVPLPGVLPYWRSLDANVIVWTVTRAMLPKAEMSEIP